MHLIQCPKNFWIGVLSIVVILSFVVFLQPHLYMFTFYDLVHAEVAR